MQTFKTDKQDSANSSNYLSSKPSAFNKGKDRARESVIGMDFIEPNLKSQTKQKRLTNMRKATSHLMDEHPVTNAV